MSFSIGQVERERGEYIEIIKTDVPIVSDSNRFTEIKYAYKSAIYECYEKFLRYFQALPEVKPLSITTWFKKDDVVELSKIIDDLSKKNKIHSIKLWKDNGYWNVSVKYA